MIDHWPPRSWCDECNEGHGRDRRHGRVPESHRVAIVSMDYAFLRRTGHVSEGDPGWDDDEALKLLIAHAVPKHAVDEKKFTVHVVVDDVLCLGYAQVILRSDNKLAIVKLLKEALSTMKVSGVGQVGEEHLPPYESQANGSVENASNFVKCIMRTVKLCLERRIGK